jgi:hypothetical protein
MSGVKETAMIEKTCTQRLQALKDRWHTESLAVHFPSLGIELANPTTCAEFIASPRIMAAEPEVNAEDFRVADPKAVLAALQFGCQVDPKALKDAAHILAVFKEDSDKLAEHFASKADETLRESYEADAKAATKCSGLIAELASELGISLTTTENRQR